MTPAALPSTTGMALDAQGRLHVANIGASRISVIDPATGALLDRFGPEEGVAYPEDLAFGPDGSLYWTGFLTGTIGRIGPDGDADVVAAIGPGANPIATGPDGRLFAGRCILGEGLYELDPTGAAAPRLIAAGIGGGCDVNGMDVGPDGRLYAPQPFLGRIVAIDVDTGALEVVAEGLSPTLFGVDVAPDGTILAVDGPVLRRVDPATGASTVLATFDFLPDNLVLDDATGTVYVSSVDTAAVVAVAPDGSVRVVSPGGFVLPQGLAVDGRGRDLLVGQISTVVRVDPRTGAPRGALASPIPNTVQSVAAAGGRWVSAGPVGGVVSLFDPAAGTATIAAAGLDFPLDAALDGDAVLVAEAGTGRVLRVPLADPFAVEVVAEGLGAPAGLAVRDGAVWVTDIAGGRVLRLRGGAAEVVAAGLDRPQGIALRGRDLVVVESGAGRVTALRQDGGRRRTLATGLTPANPPLPGRPTDAIFFGVAVDRGGVVYAADPFTNRVLRLRG